MNQAPKLTTLLQEYLAFLPLTDWPEKEIYKFEFAHWLNETVTLDTETVTTLTEKALASQEVRYTNGGGKGIQFLQSAGREKRSVWFGEADAELILQLQKRPVLTEEGIQDRTMSVTGLSAWLGTLLPYEFIPNPTTDFVAVFQYVFPTERVPGSGLAYLQYGKEKGELVKQLLRSSDAVPSLYLDLINRFRTAQGLYPVLRYSELDYNWMVEDFWLYVHRVVLELYDTSYLSWPDGSETLQEGFTERCLITISRLRRNTAIVQELKQLYAYQCQRCGVHTETSPSRFIEGAHIHPLGEPHNGRDVKGNLLILCPNHHKEFDLGLWTVAEDGVTVAPTGKSLKLLHTLDAESLQYHRSELYLG